MIFLEWILFILVIQIIHFLGTWKLYQKAGRKAWEAAIPVYNAVVLMKIIHRPWWWTILLFIPVVNLIMFPVVWVETIRSFGRNSTADTILVIVTLGLYIFYVNYATDVKYKEERTLQPGSAAGEWISSILFAIIAATIVHTYVMQPFTIPTSSLEKTLLVGDYLFVSKFHYGARTPMTSIAFPMVHDTIPVLGVKSYLNAPQIPYFRLPGFQNIERNDIVVFNWPVDTVRMFRDQSGIRYDKPVDKKSNYVKRAVGLPGDSLKIVDGRVFINNEPLQLPERARPQYSYFGTTKGQGFHPNILREYDITDGFGFDPNTNQFVVQALSEEAYQRLKNNPNVATIERSLSPQGEKDVRIFPNNRKVNWNQDNMGSVYIPKRGETVKMDLTSFSLYRRIIEDYEGREIGIDNKLSVNNGTQVLLNGDPIDSYTFKQDYYWMMGDNRHNSEDSRYWGYVPESHVVGKPVFIWLSIDPNGSGFDKIRWERMFTTVGGQGQPVSYLPYILILVVGWFGYSYFRKKKKS